MKFGEIIKSIFFFLKAAPSLHVGSWEMTVVPKTKNSVSLFRNI